jgi:exonuclease SbcD
VQAGAAAWYAGSPIQVDFGEEHDVKHVLLVEAAAGVPARVEPRPLRSGWTLRTLRGSVAELREAAADAGDAWLRVVVQESPRAGLADEVRAFLPRAVDVQVERVVTDAPVARASRQGRTARELFAEYVASEGVDDPRVLALFDRLHDDALAEAR